MLANELISAEVPNPEAMAVVPVHKVFRILGSYITIQQECWKVGLIAGAVYHLLCQFPRQRDVLTCLCVLASHQAVFLVARICLTISRSSFGPFLFTLSAVSIPHVYFALHAYGLISVCNCVGFESGVQCLLPSLQNSDGFQIGSIRLGSLVILHLRNLTSEDAATTSRVGYFPFLPP